MWPKSWLYGALGEGSWYVRAHACEATAHLTTQRYCYGSLSSGKRHCNWHLAADCKKYYDAYYTYRVGYLQILPVSTLMVYGTRTENLDTVYREGRIWNIIFRDCQQLILVIDGFCLPCLGVFLSCACCRHDSWHAVLLTFCIITLFLRKHTSRINNTFLWGVIQKKTYWETRKICSCQACIVLW